MPLLFSEKLLFLHVQKTGGLSVTEFLVDVLPKPVWYQSRHPQAPLTRDGVHHITGNPHAGLAEAARLVQRHGFALERFPRILAVLRNPYEIEVSNYEHVRQPNERGITHNRQGIAVALPFDEYIHATLSDKAKIRRRSFEDMFFLDGAVPDNMRIVNFEHLADGIKRQLREIGIETDKELPWRHRGTYGDWRSYYTPESEELVFRAHRWMFDAGLFPRLELAAAQPNPPG